MPFAVFDIETRIDKRLLNQVFFAHEAISDDEAFTRFKQDPRNRSGDFMPLTLHLPIAIAVGDVGDDYVLRSVESLAAEDYSEENLVREFWRRMESFAGVLVSFNGRGFDLPVLELAALRHGISAPHYFASADSPRIRHGGRHLDLYDFLCNFGATGLRGGMDLLLKMIAMPGKTAMDGSQVQEYFEAGRLAEIQRYCRADVIRTYFLFLRVELMRGRIDDACYRAALAASSHFRDELDALLPSS
ncbi:MAG TPA: 3'-5' exonuclease [Candidatus Binataceae bacterium]|nr:3'-5' exonuclease [Candidatus Binataceae bacterium]